jgi:O-antigen ligase
LKSATVYGVPIKNYIDQSQEFALCAVALAYPVISLWRAKRTWLAALLVAVAVSFIVNMLFVVVSRTALVTMPTMLVVFALMHLKWRSIVVMACAAALLGGTAWAMSPQLRATTARFLQDYEGYKERNQATSLGLRLEFWQKSLRFFAEAPVLGHGTGSTQGLFEQAAIGRAGAGAGVVANPHNQTLNVAVQWGVLGVTVLYAMWLSHLLLFRGDGLTAWIGLMVVAQNFFSSLFNSHIFDFSEGWMYVLGVGVAGGMMLKAGPPEAAPRTDSVEP